MRLNDCNGPIHSIGFHQLKTWIVFGGKAKKIKFWDYMNKKYLFTLRGHTKCILSVQFHPNAHILNWVLSASEDQTLRIWDYEKRMCLSVLIGHEKVVKSGIFHPTKDWLVLSASLDKTIRLWDISGLIKNETREQQSESNMFVNTLDTVLKYMSEKDIPDRDEKKMNGTFVRYILEGHAKGVNMATFHHNLPLITSASVDGSVILWQQIEEEDQCSKIAEFSAHTQSVSSCHFHPFQDLIVSISDDNSIRVWDIAKGRENVCHNKASEEKMSGLAIHRSQNIFAASHYAGVLIFKVREENVSYHLKYFLTGMN